MACVNIVPYPPFKCLLKGIQNLLAQIKSCGVLWILNITNVFPLSSGGNQGGYGVMLKV